ncbi:MAG: sulfite exporter TauE/SafE family protein, partial [Bacilli bacterium]
TGDYFEYGFHRVVAITISFAVGLIQGMFGIGGGAILVPAMILLFWFPAHVAMATSMFVILLSSIFGSVSQMILGNIDWKILLWLAPGAWLGGQLGAWLARRLNSTILVKSLRVILLLLALNALWHGIKWLD